jgi:hypothetical protein
LVTSPSSPDFYVSLLPSDGKEREALREKLELLLSASLAGTKTSWLKDVLMPLLRFERLLAAVNNIFLFVLHCSTLRTPSFSFFQRHGSRSFFNSVCPVCIDPLLSFCSLSL